MPQLTDTTENRQITHTPGPWETGCLRTRVEVHPPGWRVPLCIADCGTHRAPASESERVANARLIAAAPQLLAALAALVDYASIDQAKPGDSINIPIFGKLFDDARRAIAAAE